MTGRNLMLAMLATGAVVLGGGFPLIAAAAADGTVNACGCRQDSGGLCYCDKKSRCGCPGECEPKGCEERRAKQMDKEVQAETRKAEEAARRQHDRRAASDQEGSGAGSGVRERDTDNHSQERAVVAPKVHVVKMTAPQKRDLARLIRLYLVEHPDQGGKAIDQVENEVSRK